MNSLALLLKGSSFLVIETGCHTLKEAVYALPCDVLERMFGFNRKDWDEFCSHQYCIDHYEDLFQKELQSHRNYLHK